TNPETIAVLKETTDGRLRVITNETSLGPGPSRNSGVAAAKAPWIAFLDDDDEWLPEKLGRQLVVAEQAGHPIIVATLAHIVTPLARYVWPRRIYDNKAPFDEYLFDRNSLFKGDTLLPTSSLFLSRELFDRFQFPPRLSHEDQELLLKAVIIGKTPLLTVGEPLTIIYWEEQRE